MEFPWQERSRGSSVGCKVNKGSAIFHVVAEFQRIIHGPGINSAFQISLKGKVCGISRSGGSGPLGTSCGSAADATKSRGEGNSRHTVGTSFHLPVWLGESAKGTIDLQTDNQRT